MMPHSRPRPHRRAPLRAAALLFLLVAAAAALALLVRPAAAAVPLDPHIPHEQALLDAGFVGVPRPDQPDAPIAVDRVLVDGAATYGRRLTRMSCLTAPALLPIARAITACDRPAAISAHTRR